MLGDLQCFETEALMDQTSVEAPVLTFLFHRLLEAHPSIIVTVSIRFCNKQSLFVSTGIEIFSYLVSSRVIIYADILKGICTFRVSINQNHFLIQLT